MARVRFLRHNSPYQAGEYAVFDNSIARRLIAAGAAALVADESIDPPMTTRLDTKQPSNTRTQQNHR